MLNKASLAVHQSYWGNLKQTDIPKHHRVSILGVGMLQRGGDKHLY